MGFEVGIGGRKNQKITQYSLKLKGSFTALRGSVRDHKGLAYRVRKSEEGS